MSLATMAERWRWCRNSFRTSVAPCWTKLTPASATAYARKSPRPKPKAEPESGLEQILHELHTYAAGGDLKVCGQLLVEQVREMAGAHGDD